MVIIQETYSSKGRKIYSLEELTTGTKTQWAPPSKLAKAKHRDALIQVANRLEAAAQQSGMDFGITKIPTLSDATEETPFGLYVTKVFIPRRAYKLAERTVDSWKQYLRLRILPAFGDVPIGAITANRLTDFFVGMQAEGLACTTITRYYALLGSVFKMAAKTDVISRNPMEKVDKPAPRKDELINAGVQACTELEVQQLLEVMKNEPLKWQVVIRLLTDTGVRCGECMAIQWDDIDWKNNEISIRRSLGYTREAGKYLTTPKNRKTRKVYVSDETMALLVLHYADSCRGVHSPYVNHQNNSAEPMHPHSPNKYLTRITRKHGLPHIHPHKLRHSYASIAITNGADVCSVADNLGHADSAFTLRVYTNANEKSKRNATKICLDAVKNAGHC